MFINVNTIKCMATPLFSLSLCGPHRVFLISDLSQRVGHADIFFFQSKVVFAFRHIHHPVTLSILAHTGAVVPSNDHYYIETVAPSGDHYFIDI